MSVYTVPSLSAVDFALTAHTPVTVTSPTQALSVYSVPSLSAVDFALTTYSGFRVYDNGAAFDLCLVATADAPTGMGGQLRLRKGATTYAVYLVETSDGDASTVRIRTTTGVKAIRRKT